MLVALLVAWELVPKTGLLPELFLPALSTTLTWLLPEARRACVTLKALTAPPRVVVGGRAYRGDPHIAELVGADLFAADPRGLRSRLRERSG